MTIGYHESKESLQLQSEENVTTAPETPAADPALEKEIGKVENEITATIEKKDEATTPAAESAAEAKLTQLLAKLDTLIARMDAVESKVSEPVAPAPDPKPAPVVEAKTEEADPTGDAKPGKRRLGGW